MKMRSIVSAAGVVASGVLLLLLSACPNPTTASPTSSSTSTSSSLNTISGVVSNVVTGAPIQGATVVMGTYTAITSSSGRYEITLGSGETSVTGAFAVSDGTSYGFQYIQSGTLDASSNPSNVNVKLIPAVEPTTWLTLSGTIKDSSGNEIPTGSEVEMTFVNRNGGSSTESSSYGSGYSIETATTGSDCFVAVSVTYPAGNSSAPVVFYLKNQNITANSSAYNLSLPSTTPTTVSLSGEPTGTGASFGMGFEVSGYGSVLAYSADTSSAEVPSLTVYNPDNYRVAWGSNISQTTTAPVSVQFDISPMQAMASDVQLPQFTLTPTTVYDDVTAGGYANGTLSFSASSDPKVNIHLVQLIPVNSTGAQIGDMMGILWLSNGQVTLPASIQAVIASEINAATGNSWGIAAFAGEQSGLSTGNLFGFTNIFAGSGILGATNLEFAAAADQQSVDGSGFIQ